MHFFICAFWTRTFSIVPRCFSLSDAHPAFLNIPLIQYRQETDAQFRLAIGSYVEQYSNCVQIIKKKPSPKNPSDPTYSYENQCYVAAEFDHPYPCTKILWSPDVSSGARDLLATSGDYLRLWSMSDDGLGVGTLTAKKEALLNNVS